MLSKITMTTRTELEPCGKKKKEKEEHYYLTINDSSGLTSEK